MTVVPERLAKLRIPVARTAAGRLVTPDEATKKARHACPACGAPVDLHAGAKKQRHFHHRAGTCSYESVAHLSAKELVCDAVNAWLEGGSPVTFVRRCAWSGGCEATCRQQIPAKVATVTTEHVLPSGHVVDVALFAKGVQLPIAAIEIVHTHAVDARKAFEMGVPWIEVDAAQVCESHGRELVVTHDRFLPWLCHDHEEDRGKDRRAARDERATATALVRKLPFRMADFPGFRVAGVTSCPNGHDALVFEWEGKEPPWPRPPLVVAAAADEDWTFRGGRNGPTKLLAFRRAYVSACAICAAPLANPGDDRHS